MPAFLTASAALAMIVLMATAAAASESPAMAISVAVKPVPLDAQDWSENRVGRLHYRGGIEMTSSNDHFGGFSGLIVDDDGHRMVAVSDQGYWLFARLLYTPGGDLIGIDRVAMRPILDDNGKPFVEKVAGDAESLAPAAQATTIVAFEQDHRLRHYETPDGAPLPLPSPPGLASAPDNGGIEALTRLADGRLLAISEELDVDGGTAGWIEGNGQWQDLTFATSDRFRPTGATTLPNGDIAFVERRFPPVGARIRIVPADTIVPVPGAVIDGEEIARLEGSHTVDNMEGIAARRDATGATLIYLLSDDNFLPIQRNLLMMFEVIEK